MKKIWSVLFWVVLSIFWFLTLKKNMGGIESAIREISFSGVLATTVFLILPYFLSVHCWNKQLGMLGIDLKWIDAWKLWIISNSTKYLPGMIWQPLSRVEFGRKHGVRRLTMLISWGFEIYFIISTGLLWVAVAGVSLGESVFFRFSSAIIGVCMILAPFVLKKVFPFFWSFIEKMKSRGARERISHVRDLISKWSVKSIISITVWYLFFWWVYGLWMNGVMSLFPQPGSFLLGVSLWPLAWISGFIVLFVPGGIGVREGVLTAALIGLGWPAAAAISLAWLTRVQHIVIDGLLAITTCILTRSRAE